MSSTSELNFADEVNNEAMDRELLNKEQSESLRKGWIKSETKPEPIKKEPKPRLEGEPERAVRKKRATNEVIRNFVKWCFEKNAFDNYTNGRIRQMYFDEKGIDLTTSTINNQKKRWIVIDGKIYDVNKPYLMPKKDDSK